MCPVHKSHRLITANASLTALGIVYGDIGTSPLYAMRECFHGPHAIAAPLGSLRRSAPGRHNSKAAENP